MQLCHMSHRPRKDLYSSPVAVRATHLGRCHARLPSAVVRRSIQQVKHFADAPRRRAPQLYKQGARKGQNHSNKHSINQYNLFCLHLSQTKVPVLVYHTTQCISSSPSTRSSEATSTSTSRTRTEPPPLSCPERTPTSPP